MCIYIYIYIYYVSHSDLSGQQLRVLQGDGVSLDTVGDMLASLLANGFCANTVLIAHNIILTPRESLHPGASFSRRFSNKYVSSGLRLRFWLVRCTSARAAGCCRS